MAFAQDVSTPAWATERRYTEGIGIRVGDFELHPGFGAEFGFDSNYLLRSDSPDEHPGGALRLRLTPSFSFGTVEASRRGESTEQPAFNFQSGIHLTYDEFFPVTGDQATKDTLSTQRNVGGAVDLSLGILPGRTVSGTLSAGVTRSINPSNLGDTTHALNRDSPTAAAELAIAPSSAFDWRLGYIFTGTFFESSAFTDLDQIDNEIVTRGRWRFLPKSALTFDGRVGFLNYPAGQNPTSDKTSSHPIRARIGYNGLITNAIAVTVMGGWGASFYQGPTPQEDFDSFIGQAEIKFLLSGSPGVDPGSATLSLSNLAFGFTRDFSDSFIGTYVESDKGYGKFSYFFAGRFLLVLDAAVTAARFPKIADLNVDPFTDILVEGGAFGEIRFAKYFAANATVRYFNNISSTILTGGVPGYGALQYQDFQAYLGARWFM